MAHGILLPPTTHRRYLVLHCNRFAHAVSHKHNIIPPALRFHGPNAARAGRAIQPRTGQGCPHAFEAHLANLSLLGLGGRGTAGRIPWGTCGRFLLEAFTVTESASGGGGASHSSGAASPRPTANGHFPKAMRLREAKLVFQSAARTKSSRHQRGPGGPLQQAHLWVRTTP